MWFGVASLGANAILAGLSRRLGAQRLLVVSPFGLAATLALTAFTQDRLWLIVALFAAWSVCSAFFGTLQQARVVDAAPASGTAMLALNASAVFAGQALGTVIGGGVIAFAGVCSLPWASAALAALASVVLALSRRVRLS